jgi:hypothetical protein
MQGSPRANHADDADFDVVDAASAQSFPASDPPAWATGREYPAPLRDGAIGPLRRGERRMRGVHSMEARAPVEDRQARAAPESESAATKG